MLLSVEKLSTYFILDEGELKAVDDVSFTINEEETVALVGESGCGKTVVAHSLINLVSLPGRIIGGKILFHDQDILKLNEKKMRNIRGREIGIIFQEPGAALNPVLSVGYQISEVIRVHKDLSRHKADAITVGLMGDMGIPEPEKWVKAYPHELSGGMQQRIAIAIATCTRPKLLIADEPTTALDVTVQAEILELLRYLQEQYKMAILLITHDLGIVAEMAHKIMVMYAGKIFETALTEDIYKNPKHPYTIGLLNSVPRFGAGKNEPLQGIPGSVPDFLKLPSGCSFHPRCTLADKICSSEFPPLREIKSGHHCSCFKV